MRVVEIPDQRRRNGAAEVVRRHLAPTPVVLSPRLGDRVYLKLETLQPTGSFKVRGGLAAVAAANDRQAGSPLVAASAGNHGLGVAYAAERLGARATVVVSEQASPAKVSALGRYGVELIRHGADYDEAEAMALALAEEQGGRFISPYNDADVIAGQATCASEFAQQVEALSTVVVPVGGGGLISGTALTLENAGVRIVGVEPAASPAMSTSLAAGHAEPIVVGRTLADGLAGNIEAGSVTIGICASHGVEVMTVTEEEIRAAIRFLAHEHGVVAEGAGAVGVAAVCSGAVLPSGGDLVVIVTGRNIAPPLLTSVLAE
jgi:threonine dehydratase